MENDMYDQIDSSSIYSDVEPEDIHNKMLMGSYIRGNSRLVFASGIDGRTFLKFPADDIHQYLLENCVFKVRRNTFTPLRIIKVEVSKTGDYNVIDKTYWIRLIQRCWRARIAQHKVDIVMLQKKYLYHREIHGNYPGSARIKGKKLIGLL